MKKRMKKITALAISALFGFVTANAAGTDYNVDITNSATLTFTVGGVTQTALVSNVDTFKVDRKVDVLVATSDAANVTVVPGDNLASGAGTTKPLTFTVTNETNGNQDFVLSAENLASGTASLAGGPVDNQDFASNLVVCTDATCSAGDISGTNISFTEDEAKTYYVFADIPLTALNLEVGSIALKATAVNDGTTTVMVQDTGVDNPTVVQIVFADDAGDASGDSASDGVHSTLSAYQVVTATITATKGSCVIWDPVNLTTNPKRVPGAVVRYAIGLSNAGSASASGASLADTLQADLTYGTSGSAPTAVALIATEACDCENPGTSNGDTVSNAGQVVTANYGTIAATTTECAYFDVTIN